MFMQQEHNLSDLEVNLEVNANDDLNLKNHLNKLKNDDDLYLNKYITIVPIDKEAPSSDW